MARGPKKHLKRVNAPSSWMLGKLEGSYAPKTSSGPHKMRESLPLILVLRNKLKYALTRAEAQAICMNKLVQVDKRVRTDMNFPVGFMDVVEMSKAGKSFRIMYDTKGRFVLHPLGDAESNFKLCRVTRQELTAKGIPYVATHDGRTIRYPDPDVKVNDTVKVDLSTGKIVDFVKFELGSLAFITRGHNTGRIGVITQRDRHPGSFDIVHVQDLEGHTFATRLSNVFVIGKTKTDALVSLPRGNGVKRSIFEQRDARLRHLAAGH